MYNEVHKLRGRVNWVVYLGMNDGETLEQPPRGNAMLLQNLISNSYGIYFRDYRETLTGFAVKAVYPYTEVLISGNSRSHPMFPVCLPT